MSNFCPKCGTHLDSRGLCPSCNPESGVSDLQNVYSGVENQQPVYNQSYQQNAYDGSYSQSAYDRSYQQNANTQSYNQSTYEQGYQQTAYDQGYQQSAYDQNYQQATYDRSYPQNGYNQEYYAQEPAAAPKKKSKAPVIILVIVLVLLLAAGSVFALWHFDIIDLPIPGKDNEKTESVDSDKTSEEPEDEDYDDEPSTEESSAPSTEAPSIPDPEEADTFIGTDINSVPTTKPDMKSKYENGVLSYSNNSLTLYSDTEGRISKIVIEEGSTDYCLFGIENSMSISEAANILSAKGYSEADTAYAVMKRYISAAGEEVILWNDGSGNVSKIEYSLVSQPDNSEDDEDDNNSSDDSYDVNSPNRAFSHAFASSTLDDITVNGIRYSYSASHLIDNDINTCWAEGAQSDGTGEEVNISSDTSERIYGICIYNGYAKNESVYEMNNRAREITIYFDDGSYETATLKDGFSNSRNIIVFDNPVDTKSVRIRFDSIYFSDEESDLCISEIYLF